CRLTFVFVAGEDRDRRSSLGQSQRQTASNPAVPAGDDRNLAAEIENLPQPALVRLGRRHLNDPSVAEVLCAARAGRRRDARAGAAAAGILRALDVAAAGPYIGLSELAKSSATVRAAAAARNQQGR